ncbi:hypothetical protein BC833DRAFT_617651 [Globomyces pollinis-pini]|nr:hypothetical protein BC833DRAFT_617651 [Globomyces pollinis-pini]
MIANKKKNILERLNEKFFQAILTNVDENYLKSRILRPSWISKPHLILFGIGMVISGEFAAWNVGLSYGWGSLAVSTIIVNIYFWCLLLCVGELSSALPFSGGALTFVTATMGNVFGYILGLVIFMQTLLVYSQTVLIVGNFYMSLANLTLDQIVYWNAFQERFLE